MKKGWVLLYRKLLDSSVYGNEILLKLFVTCLLKANHSETEIILEGVNDPIKLKPGQFVTGRYSLHSDYYSGQRGRKSNFTQKVSPQTLFRKLKVLSSMEILNIKSTNKYSIITITNWDKYQKIDGKQNNKLNNNVTSAEHQMNTDNNDKQCKKNEKDAAAPTPPTGGGSACEKITQDEMKAIRTENMGKVKSLTKAIADSSTMPDYTDPITRQKKLDKLQKQLTNVDGKIAYCKDPEKLKGYEKLKKKIEYAISLYSVDPENRMAELHQQKKEVLA